MGLGAILIVVPAHRSDHFLGHGPGLHQPSADMPVFNAQDITFYGLERHTAVDRQKAVEQEKAAGKT